MDMILTIHNAKVCLEPDCEAIYSGDRCPRCMNSEGFKIADVLPPLKEREGKCRVGNGKQGTCVVLLP